jgi:hypothetical protein
VSGRTARRVERDPAQEAALAPADAAELDALQRWFQAAVMHAGGAEGAVRDAAVQALLPGRARALEEVLEPSSELTAQDRLDVYASSYVLRLIDVMKNDFPGVLHALREEAFEKVVREYVTAHPSTSFTLNDLGARFPRFLADAATVEAAAARRKFLAELAALERAVEDVFHERHVPPADVERLRSIPIERWSGARFALIPASRLLAFEHPVNRYLQDVYDGRQPDPPAPAPAWILVYRRDWRSWRARLTIEQHGLLTALGRGLTLGAALEEALTAEGSDPDLATARLGDWFREWTAEGLFAAIEIRGPA